MPNYKVVDAGRLDAAMTATADAIREKTSGTDSIPWNADTGFAEAVAGITGGGAAVSVPMKDVNFYDYDGTRLYSYTVEEAAALTELPPLPTQDGLICQGWNWTLDGIKAMGRAVDVGAHYITNDGKTRVYITLQGGRTSPILGCCPNGTVTVDWGDGTVSDVITGDSLSAAVWTPRHEYSQAGDYVITLTVDGTMNFYGNSTDGQYSGILRYSSTSDNRNKLYINAVRRIEIGENVAGFRPGAFRACSSLISISVPNTVDSFGTSAAFYDCRSLRGCTIPYGIDRITTGTFTNCYNLIVLPIPSSVTNIQRMAFSGWYNLSNVVLPDGILSIAGSSFLDCGCLANVVFPASLTSINALAFSGCAGVKFYDFSRHIVVPELLNVDAFAGIAEDCEIRVPAALADEWKAATNWSAYADYIVGV